MKTTSKDFEEFAIPLRDQLHKAVIEFWEEREGHLCKTGVLYAGIGMFFCDIILSIIKMELEAGGKKPPEIIINELVQMVKMDLLIRSDNLDNIKH